jgi:hypothetical protein
MFQQKKRLGAVSKKYKKRKRKRKRKKNLWTRVQSLQKNIYPFSPSSLFILQSSRREKYLQNRVL